MKMNYLYRIKPDLSIYLLMKRKSIRKKLNVYLLMCLKGSVTETETHTHRDLPSVYSDHNSHKSQIWARLKPRTINSTLIFLACDRSPSTKWKPCGLSFSVFPGILAAIWIRNTAARI